MGETWADTASQGVCDFEIYSKFTADYEAYFEVAEGTFYEDEPHRYVHDAAAEAVLLITSSGFGDGSFKLFELVEGGTRVGLEVEMIEPGAEHPFM